MHTTQERPASQGPELTQYRLARLNVIATFPGMAEARSAIEALGAAGVPGQRITLRGTMADRAAREATGAPESARADAAVMRHWLEWVVKGSVLGGITGVALGVPVGFGVMIAIGEDITGLSALVAACMGLLFGATIGGLLAYVMPVQDAEAWELTFHEAGPGPAIVGVHSENLKDIERAREVFSRLGAEDVRVVGPVKTPEELIVSMIGRS